MKKIFDFSSLANAVRSVVVFTIMLLFFLLLSHLMSSCARGITASGQFNLSTQHDATMLQSTVSPQNDTLNTLSMCPENPHLATPLLTDSLNMSKRLAKPISMLKVVLPLFPDTIGVNSKNVIYSQNLKNLSNVIEENWNYTFRNTLIHPLKNPILFNNKNNLQSCLTVKKRSKLWLFPS